MWRQLLASRLLLCASLNQAGSATNIFPSPEGDAEASLDTLSSIVRAIASGEVRRHLQAQADVTEVCRDPRTRRLSVLSYPRYHTAAAALRTQHLLRMQTIPQRGSDRHSGTDVLLNQAAVFPLRVVQPSSSPLHSSSGSAFLALRSSPQICPITAVPAACAGV